MSNIKIENLSLTDALQLLKNVQKNHAKSYAIQGGKGLRWINTDTVNATVKPQENDSVQDFSKNTFEIYSNYWTESTLKEFISA